MNIRRILRLAFEVFCWLIAFTDLAHAGFLVAAFSAFASFLGGSSLIAGIVKLAIGIALKVGLSLLQRAKQQKQRAPGINSDITVGGNNPQAFIVGLYATAGQLEYINTAGNSGDTPNAYLTYVITLSDIPVSGFTNTIWVDGKKCTISGDLDSGGKGYGVTEYKVGGAYKLWVKYYDGTQTAPDTYCRSAFGADPNRPYTADMIGYGVAYAVVTCLLDRNLFNGFPKFVFEVNGIKLYNPAKDSTNGGSGSHRWADPTTWEFTTNNAVIIYNIIRGIYYNGDWVYGGQNLPSVFLPSASWIAAINECDVLIPLLAGGTEKQYRAGYEINVNDEPLGTIESFLDGCSGRMAEIGGYYKIKVGAPTASVYSFTDGDIVATEDLNFDPFPGLEATYNGAHASYPEPGEAWQVKDAPPYSVAADVTADEGRDLQAALTFSTTPYPTQVQRLMKAAVEANRKFRRHIVPLPPEAWLLEPGDTVSWTSAREGYTNKQFVISQMTGRAGMIQLVSLQEVDAADYNWTPSTDEKPYSISYVGSVTPSPQVIFGWNATPATLYDENGNPRGPSINVSFPGNNTDVASVHVQVKLSASPDTDIVLDTVIPYGDPNTNPNPKQVILGGVLLPWTNYKVRGIFIPYSGRATDWSSWVDVKTPDIDIGDLRNTLANTQQDLRDLWASFTAQMDDIIDRVRQVAFASAQMGGRVVKDNAAAVQFQTAAALSFTELNASITDIDGQLTAQAAAITGVQASVGLLSASGLFQMIAQAGTGDVVAKLVAQVRATTGDAWVDAGYWIEAGFTGGNPLLPFSNFVIKADKFTVTDGTNKGYPMTFTGGVLTLNVANIGTVVAGLITGPTGALKVDATNEFISIAVP